MHDYSVLISVALPSSGPELLRVARLLADQKALRITALHCLTDPETRDEALDHPDAGPREGALDLLLCAADDVHIDPVYAVGSSVEEDILSTARRRSSDLILMGWHRPMVDDGESPGPVRGVLELAETDVAVFLARQFRPIQRVLVPFHGGRHDRRALELAARIARRTDISVTVLHVVAPDRPASTPGTGWTNVVDEVSDGRVRLKVVESEDPVEAAVREAWTGYDLIVAGASEVWGVDFSLFSERLQRLAFATPASLLVVHTCRSQQPSNASDSKDEKDHVSLVDGEA